MQLTTNSLERTVCAVLLLLLLHMRVSTTVQAQASIPTTPTAVAIYLEAVNGRLHARVTWTQTSAANEILVMRQPATGYAMLVDQLLSQTAGVKSLRDPQPAEPNDAYYVREFIRDARGVVSEIGLYGPYQVGPPPVEQGTDPALPLFVQYMPLVAH